MDCTITTLNFEGPLDLLLHLIKEGFAVIAIDHSHYEEKAM